MDLIMQFQENRDEMYALINAQREAMDRQNIRNIEDSAVFSVDALRDVELEGRMNEEQNGLMDHYRFKQQEYGRELRELEQRRNEPDWILKYNAKRIQAEQNDMEMRLMMASALGRGTVAERIRMESLEKIISYRRGIREYYNAQSNLWWFQKRSRDKQEEEIAKEEAMQKEAAAKFSLRVLTTAALSNIEAERGQPEDADGVIRDFLDAEYSTRALEADYVIQHLNTCLHNVELIRRADEMAPEHRGNMAEDAYAPVRQKLEAVREYVNVVENVLWEYGLTIDYGVLQIREINRNDEVFARRRRVYQESGALRYYLGARRYRHMGADGEQIPGEQEEPARTRVEAKLSELEAKLGIRDYIEGDMRIMRSHIRRVDEIGRTNPGDEIRASGEDAQGKMEDRQVKMRIFRIYHMLKGRITEKLAARHEEGADAFQALEEFVNNYVLRNREIYENRREAEEEEAEALAMLKGALVRVQKSAKNKCSKYAAILLGLLEEDNNGYLEVPSDEIYLIEDSRIALGKRKTPVLSILRTYRDCTDMPLFTHRPNIKDIEQGYLGDCYLLAGLISVVDYDAEAIMNMMRDNGDGTVTVCFKREERQEDGRRVYTPYYVTVTKTIPVYRLVGGDAFSRGALWVKMMEKAYAASGLHLAGKEKMNHQDYQVLKESIQRGERRVDYDEIEGGWSGEFTSLLLGKENHDYIPYKNRADTAADRIGRLLPPVAEPQWDPDPARRYGDENADSIVYEFISRVISGGEDMFLHMKKPAQNAPNYDALMHQYKGQRLLLQDYVRSCKLHLDIVDTIAREQGTDILKLDSERKIENWYRKLKTMFAHFYNNTQSENPSLSEDDKIIDGVRKSFYGHNPLSRCFSRITQQEFNCTVDILQSRHLELLRRNQQRRQGEENGNAVQAQHSYYTKRDRKLYESIKRALETGSYVAFGTKKFTGKGTGMNGETESGGLVGGHAYSIINTCRKMVGDKEYLFLVVMNPWAAKGVVYDSDVNRIRERAIQGQRQGEQEEGVFLLDLKKFAEIVTHWDSVPA